MVSKDTIRLKTLLKPQIIFTYSCIVVYLDIWGFLLCHTGACSQRPGVHGMSWQQTNPGRAMIFRIRDNFKDNNSGSKWPTESFEDIRKWFKENKKRFEESVDMFKGNKDSSRMNTGIVSMKRKRWQNAPDDYAWGEGLKVRRWLGEPEVGEEVKENYLGWMLGIAMIDNCLLQGVLYDQIINWGIQSGRGGGSLL